jgi:CRISPR-associated protein (TIGR03984 family)
MSKIIDLVNQYHQQLAPDSWVLAYTHSEVFVEKLNQNGGKLPNLDEKDIKEIRIFSDKAELYIWKNEGQIQKRLFEQKADWQEYKEKMILWGTIYENGQLIDVTKGPRFSFSPAVSQDALPLAIHVLNYYDFDENGQIHFQDARLEKITDKHDKEIM